MKLFSNERKTDTDCVSRTCNTHLLEINIWGVCMRERMFPMLKSRISEELQFWGVSTPSSQN